MSTKIKKLPKSPSAQESQALAPWRKKIDAIDLKILKLLNERAVIAQKIGAIKENSPVFRPEREVAIFKKLNAQNAGPLSDSNIRGIFKEIISASRALEEPLAIAFLGPNGTFSESAARQHFGHAANYHAAQSIDAVFQKVEAGKAHFGVVPVENSTEGSVARTLDLLLTTPLNIVGEVVLRVAQNLFSNATDFADIKKVYAHAQSLAQCRTWLNLNLPHAEKIAVASNAAAVSKAAKDKTAAAIAGKGAALHYDVAILEESIEIDPKNRTRFFVLGNQEVPATGADRTSLMMAAPNRTGALHEMLLPFSACGVSMTHLESRPIANALWEYVFFVDLEGHKDDFAVAAALKELNHRAAYLKILGSYPRA